jgi:hypothetical protein
MLPDLFFKREVGQNGWKVFGPSFPERTVVQFNHSVAMIFHLNRSHLDLPRVDPSIGQ